MTDAAPAKKARQQQPTIRELVQSARCPECGGPVVRRSPRGPAPTFCSPECKRTRGNRRLVRGSAIIEFAQAWRACRGQGEVAQQAFAQMNRILDQFNAEDHAAARPRADLCAAHILADGTQYFDRQRR